MLGGKKSFTRISHQIKQKILLKPVLNSVSFVVCQCVKSLDLPSHKSGRYKTLGEGEYAHRIASSRSTEGLVERAVKLSEEWFTRNRWSAYTCQSSYSSELVIMFHFIFLTSCSRMQACYFFFHSLPTRNHPKEDWSSALWLTVREFENDLIPITITQRSQRFNK